MNCCRPCERVVGGRDRTVGWRSFGWRERSCAFCVLLRDGSALALQHQRPRKCSPALRACLSLLPCKISCSNFRVRSSSSLSCLLFRLAIRSRKSSTVSESSLDASMMERCKQHLRIELVEVQTGWRSYLLGNKHLLRGRFTIGPNTAMGGRLCVPRDGKRQMSLCFGGSPVELCPQPQLRI